MKPDDALLVRTSALSENPCFVVTCGEATLRWLAQSFRSLRRGEAFLIGDDGPVGSDGKSVVEVALRTAHTAIVTLSEGQFRWVVSTELARRYADLIDGVADCACACHQYLETDKPHLPLVLISKGEYDPQTLRQMRDLVEPHR